MMHAYEPAHMMHAYEPSHLMHAYEPAHMNACIRACSHECMHTRGPELAHMNACIQVVKSSLSSDRMEDG